VAPLPVTLRGNAVLASSPMRLDDLSGQVGDAAVRGALTLDAQGRVAGKLTASRLDVPAVLAAAIGAQRSSGQASSSQAWSPQAFAGMPVSEISGEIQIEAAQGALTPALPLGKMQGTLTFAPTAVSFTDVSAALAGGTLSGQAEFRATPAGMAVTGKVAVSNGDASKLMRNATQAPIAGRMSSQVEFEGAGSSPAALIGALRGTGTITLENAQIATLDPKAIDGAIRTAERGPPVAPARIADMVTRMMEAGVMNVSWASAPIEISTGRARLGKLVMPAHANELAVGASLDLVEETLDARFTLFGQGAPVQGRAPRPEVSVALKGPISAPRRSVDVSVLVGWLTLQAVDREAKKLEAEEREAERRARLDAIIRERAEKIVQPPQPAAPVVDDQPTAVVAPSAPPRVVPPAAAAPVHRAAPSSRMPPPPRAERQPPRAGVIETAPLMVPR
jgi:hypothetical protein